MLHLDVPSDLAETEVEVTVILRPVLRRQASRGGEQNWSAGFFEEVVGAWQGGALARQHEGEYEVREKL